VVCIKKVNLKSEYGSLLSSLEADVLNILWPHNKMKVRDIYDSLKTKRKVALSSVAVILDRLHERGIVERNVEKARGGLRYTYFPKKDKKQFEQSVVENVVDKLIDRFGSTAVNYFNERFKKRRSCGHNLLLYLVYIFILAGEN